MLDLSAPGTASPGVTSSFRHLCWTAVSSLSLSFPWYPYLDFWGASWPWIPWLLPSFHLLSTSLPFLSTKPHGVHHFSGALSISSTPSVPTVFLARLPGKPASLQQADCLASTHIWAAGRYRRRSHSCSACCHQHFRTFTLPGLLTVSGGSFSFLKLFTLFISRVCPRLLPDPCTCLFPVLSSSDTPCVVSMWLLSSLPGEWNPHPFIWPLRYPCDLVPT